MKRLTEKRESPLVMSMWAKDSQSLRIYNRLAAIEDILCDDTDEYDLDRLAVMCNQRITMRKEVSERFSLTAKIPLDRLRELVEADRDGRCVVVPCKLGDTVFKIGASICMWRETDHCDEYCNGYEYRDCWEGCRAVCEDKFSLDDLQRFGKNVFLTREAAEAALKAREQDE